MNKYIVRELLNGYGIFSRTQKSVCLHKFYKYIDAINHCYRLNNNTVE